MPTGHYGDKLDLTMAIDGYRNIADLRRADLRRDGAICRAT